MYEWQCTQLCVIAFRVTNTSRLQHDGRDTGEGVQMEARNNKIQ